METGESLVAMLRSQCEQSSQREFARQAGLSETLVSLVLSGKRPMTASIAKALGYQKKIAWQALQQ